MPPRATVLRCSAETFAALIPVASSLTSERWGSSPNSGHSSRRVLADGLAEGAPDSTPAEDFAFEAALETPPPHATASVQAPDVNASEARVAIRMLRF